CSPTTALRSAWTAKALGGTTCSSSVCGAASNTRRCICGPTTAYPRPALQSADTWTFTMAGVRTRALTAPRPIKPTSPRCPSAWQPNPADAPLIDAENLFRQPGSPQFFSMHVRNTYPDAIIHAYEPNPNMKRFLEHQSGIGGSTYFLEAVGKKDDMVHLDIDAKESVHTKCRQGGDIPQVAFRTCLLRLGGNVDLLKLDCEGA